MPGPPAAATFAVNTSKRIMTKKELEDKRSLARILYMSGIPQTEIAERTSVSRVTLSKWVNTLGWDKIRAGQNITRQELINKLLQYINAILDKIIEKGDSEALASAGDRLSKLAAVVEKLDRRANVVDVIEVFMAFNDWLLRRMETDRELTPDIIRTINGYQDRYVSGMVNQHI